MTYDAHEVQTVRSILDRWNGIAIYRPEPTRLPMGLTEAELLCGYQKPSSPFKPSVGAVDGLWGDE